MWTNDLIKALQEFVERYGDKPVVVDDEHYTDVVDVQHSGRFCVLKFEE